MTQLEQTITQDKQKLTPTIDDLINTTNIKSDDVKIDSSSDDYISEEPINSGKEYSDAQERERKGNEKEKEEVGYSSEQTATSNLDEYGNEIPKARMYTEEEVNRMMRERFSRSSFAQQQTQTQHQATTQEVKQAAEGFKPDPNSNESWDIQLNKFIDHRLEEKFDYLSKKKEERAKENEWKQKENIKQQEFEHKFSNGMERYKDFREVAGQMPITDGMLVAARDFKDPAAFVYAASKNHPEELKRISQLADPYQQAVEIGRLEERMRKNRAITKAAPPLRNSTSDVSEKVEPKFNIDHHIHSHAKRKSRR